MRLKDFLNRIKIDCQDSPIDNVECEIKNGEAIWQHKLWRRWVMGQVFHMLSWGKDKTLSESNYDRRLSRFTTYSAYKYAKKEKKMQHLLLENKDMEEYEERRRWFSSEVLNAVLRNPYSEILPESYKQAYKGNGAYFTMKNLIMFHKCCFVINGVKLSTEDSLAHLKTVNFNSSTTANELFALMLKLIKDNNYKYTIR